MSEAAAVDTHEHGAVMDQLEPSVTPGNLGKLGMWTFLAGDAMTFGAGIAAYGALRIGNPNWPSPAAYLGITTTAIMTFILICSSLTMVEALERHPARQPGEVPQLHGADRARRLDLPRDAGV